MNLTGHGALWRDGKANCSVLVVVCTNRSRREFDRVIALLVEYVYVVQSMDLWPCVSEFSKEGRQGFGENEFLISFFLVNSTRGKQIGKTN